MKLYMLFDLEHQLCYPAYANVFVSRIEPDAMPTLSGRALVLLDSDHPESFETFTSSYTALSDSTAAALACAYSEGAFNGAEDAVLVAGGYGPEDVDGLRERGASLTMDLRSEDVSWEMPCAFPRSMFDIHREEDEYGELDYRFSLQHASLTPRQLRLRVLMEAFDATNSTVSKLISILYDLGLSSVAPFDFLVEENVFQGVEFMLFFVDLMSFGHMTDDVEQLIRKACSVDAENDRALARRMSRCLSKDWEYQAATAGYPDFKELFSVVIRCWESVSDVADDAADRPCLRLRPDNSEAFESIAEVGFALGIDIMLESIIDKGIPIEHVIPMAAD